MTRACSSGECFSVNVVDSRNHSRCLRGNGRSAAIASCAGTDVMCITSSALGLDFTLESRGLYGDSSEKQGMQKVTTRGTARTPGGQQHASRPDGSGSAELVTEMLNLRRPLDQIASLPAVAQAHRLTAQVALVLEPVWSVVNTSGAAGTSGIGYLRRYGSPDPNQEAAAINAAVAKRAVRAYGSLDLVAPATRDVWQALARPAEALWCSVQGKNRQFSQGGTTSGGTVTSVTPTVRPALPTALLGPWGCDNDVVPLLRRLLKRWCELARRSSGEQGEAARLTLAAAMLTRGAVLDGDSATVKWFIDKWLGLSATEARIDGASAALLENGWMAPTVDSELSAVIDAVTSLRVDSKYQHRLHRPVWETQLGGFPVSSLSEEFQSADGSYSLTLADALVNEADISP